jgi:hypothetical protein
MKNETTHVETAATAHSNVLDFAETLNELSSRVTPDLVRQRPLRRHAKGDLQVIEYVEWHTVADILDEHAPDWKHTIRSVQQIGDIVAVIVAVTIGEVTREGIGTGRADSETGIKKAEHDALKRAAVKFGVARELYRRGKDVNGEIADKQSLPSEPVARSMGDMVTAKQLGMIRSVARNADADPDAECAALFRCRVGELSKKAASHLIDHLRQLPRPAAEAVRWAS